MSPTLGYWKLRGLAQPIRLMLEYGDIEYKEKLYDADTHKEWFEKDKISLGLDFPNLPYWIEGDFKITESRAIIRFVAEKCNLIGRTPEERATFEMIADVAFDLRMNLGRNVYGDIDWEATGKKNVIEGSKKFLESLSSYLNEKKFFGGDGPMYPDFVCYDFIHCICYVDMSIIPRNLIEFLKRFQQLPKIQVYMKSSKFISWPINGYIAKFGGSGPEPELRL